MSRLSNAASPSARNAPTTDYSSVLADTTTLPSFKERLELIRKRTRPSYEAADRPPIGHLGFRHRRGGRPNAPDADDFDDSLSTLSYHTQSNFSLLDTSEVTPRLTEDVLRRHDSLRPHTPSLPSLPPASPWMHSSQHIQTQTQPLTQSPQQPRSMDTSQWIEQTEREQRRLRKGKDILGAGPLLPPVESPVRTFSPSPPPPPPPPRIPHAPASAPASAPAPAPAPALVPVSALPRSQIYEPTTTTQEKASQTFLPPSTPESAKDIDEPETKVPEWRASPRLPIAAPEASTSASVAPAAEEAVQMEDDAGYPGVEFDDVLDFGEDIPMDGVEPAMPTKPHHAVDDIMDFDLGKPPLPLANTNSTPDSSSHDLFDESTQSKRIRPNQPAHYTSRFLHDRKHRGHYMLPRQVVRKVVSKFTNKSITVQGNERINQVTSMFFEQVMGDLNAYAEHAGRDVVTTGDVELLMHRQGQLSDTSSVEALAHDFLPRELYDRICVSALAHNELYPDNEDDYI